MTLDQEILRSELLKVTILSVFFFFLACYVALWDVIDPTDFNLIFEHKVNNWTPTAVLLSISVYYYFILRILSLYKEKQMTHPKWISFVIAFIEVSLPTVFIYFISQIHGPAYGLLSGRMLLYFIFIILSALSLNPRLCYFTGLVAAIEYAGLTFYFLNFTNFVENDLSLFTTERFITRSLVFFVGGCITAFVTKQIKNQLMNAFEATKEREEIANIFGCHVSPEVVNMLLSQGKTKLSEAKFVCVLFLDIRNFTSYSENKKPQEVVTYLNKMFDFMIDIINKNHGIINKFLGDGFMAVFGAPISDDKDTDNALQAAEEILIQIEKEIVAGTIPKTRIGIGIHCGMVVTGNVGALKRQEYTIIGDVVNLASRIEQLNKKYSSQLLISEDVYLGLQEQRGELLGDIIVQGRQKPIKIYRLK